MMKSAIFAAVCLVAVAAVSADTFTWSSSAGFFTVKDVAFRTPFNVPYGPGVAVECVISGRTTDVVTAGTVKFNLWEDDVAHFEDNGNLPYFHCNNKGCDSSSPIALFLDEPSAEATDYEVRFQFIMTEAQSSGDFHLVVFGQDQHHYPYDFSVTVAYNYTEAATAPQLTAPFALPKPSLRGAVEATPEAPQYQYNITNGNFTVDSLTFTSPDGGFTAGTVATVKMTGVIEDSTILAGTVKYKFYEFGAQHFVAGGNSPYFQCTNKGCNPADGVSLHLGSPTSVPTSFTLTLNVVLPKMLPGATNPFILEVWGVDQDHTPYDFVASIRYALSA